MAGGALEGCPGGVGLCCQGTGTGAKGMASGWARAASGWNLQEFPHGKGGEALAGEIWNAHPWRCARNSWRWHSGLRAGDKMGTGHSWDWMGWEGFSNLRDFGVL